jgi:hypothetical protein
MMLELQFVLFSVSLNGPPYMVHVQFMDNVSEA